MRAISARRRSNLGLKKDKHVLLSNLVMALSKSLPSYLPLANPLIEYTQIYPSSKLIKLASPTTLRWETVMTHSMDQQTQRLVLIPIITLDLISTKIRKIAEFNITVGDK